MGITMKMHELLAGPNNWAKSHYALTATGRDCAINDPEATRFCVVGAMRRCYGDQMAYSTPFCDRVRAALGVLPGAPLTSFNDAIVQDFYTQIRAPLLAADL